MSFLDSSELERLKNLVSGKGELIFAQRSGSWSFNLSLPTSDVDYFGVFVAPDPLDIQVSTIDHAVSGKADDWVLYEIGKYAELVAKGNPKVVEPLFANHFVYVTPLWEKLVQLFRPMVINKLTVLNYSSFASFEVQDAVKKKAKAKETATLASHGKPLYHGLRLAREAKRMIQGLPPRVWWDGEEREELMSIRTGQAKKSFDEVAAQVKAEVDEVKSLMATAAIPERLNMNVIGDWIVEVRLPVLREKAKSDGFDLTSIAGSSTETAVSSTSTSGSSVIAASGASTVHAASESNVTKMGASLSAPESSAVGKFAHIISRTHHMLEKYGLHDSTVMFIAPIGTELMWMLSGKDSACRESPSETSSIPDYLVVYRLPVVCILNPLKDVPAYLIEYPKEKYGSGIWAIELETALSQVTRHHVAFESLLALPNDVRCVSGTTIWAHPLWEPYAKILADVWQRGAAVTFGLVSHYLGVATGLLKSRSIWSTESAPLVSAESSGRVMEGESSSEASARSSSEAQSPEMDLPKAYQLALRLFMQASQLLPMDDSKSSLLSKSHCEEIISVPRARSNSAGDIDWVAKRDALWIQVSDLQTHLKKLKIPTELPKDAKTALKQELRKSRYQTIPH